MYIVFDLDKTLLNEKSEVSPYTLKVLNKCKEQGHILVINTARSLPSAKPYIETINPHYSILNAGGLVIDDKFLVLYEKVMSANEVNKIIKSILPVTSKISVETIDGLLSNDPTYQNPLSTYDDLSNIKLPCYKILPYVDDLEEYYKIVGNISAYNTRYESSPWHRISASSKYLGLIELLKITKHDISECISFGDDFSDLEMLEKANGVAMANSIPEVLEKIKKVTKSNVLDGVAWYLENNIL